MKFGSLFTFLTLLSFEMTLFGTTPHAYVTEFDGDAVSIIDVKRNTTQKIFGFNKPHVVRVTFDGTTSYVGDSDMVIYKINCIEHTVEPITKLSSHPVALCILPDASYLYAATSSGTLGIINLQTHTLEKEIQCLYGPQDIRPSPDGQFVYVSNKGNGSISVIKTSDHSIHQVIEGMHYPVGLMFTIDGDYLYATDSVSNLLYVIESSTNTIVDTILGFSEPRYISMAPGKNVAYISNGGNDSISILRLSDNFITGSIQVPNPSAMGITSDGAYLYVASDKTSVFKINTIDGGIELVIPDFANPSNMSFTDNNAPSDTVNGWQVSNSEEPYNQITWSAPAGNPFQYRIYADSRSSRLIATIPCTSEKNYLYNDPDINQEQTYSYYVIADYSNGFSSTIGEVIITPQRVGLPH